jgi:uncharacterized Zn finger protein
MNAKDRPRFDVDALQAVAGSKVFARGEAYHREGKVEILALEPGRVEVLTSFDTARRHIAL